MDYRELIEKNYEFYRSLRPDNPPNTYTVIATLNERQTGKLLALATGTQAKIKTYRHDIEDCHAESLLKRAYKRYLIGKISRAIQKDGRMSATLECPEELIFFVSQLPCGLVDRYEGEQPRDEVTGDILRRKPGRGLKIDGQLHYVEKNDCTSKLHKWISEGMQGEAINNYLYIECPISSILIGNCQPEEDFHYRFHLNQLRLHLLRGCRREVEFVHINSFRHDEFVFNPEKQARPECLVWWLDESNLESAHGSQTSNLKGRMEIIVDGRRRGATKKQCESDDDSQRSSISSHMLRKDLDAAIQGIEDINIEELGNPPR